MFTHIPSVPFLLFLFSFLPSHFFRLSSLHPRREVVPYIQLRDLGSAVSIYWPVPPRHKTSHRISLIDHVVTVPDLERRTFNNCYEGPSLPGAGHVSPARSGDMDIRLILAADLRTLKAFHMRCQRQISGIRWIDHISNTTVSSHTGSRQLASKLLAVASQSLAILPDWVRRSQHTRLSVPTSTYHLVVCLVGTGSAVLVDQTTDGSIRFVTTPQHTLDVMAIIHSPSPWLRSDATALAGYANMMMMMMLLFLFPGEEPQHNDRRESLAGRRATA